MLDYTNDKVSQYFSEIDYIDFEIIDIKNQLSSYLTINDKTIVFYIDFNPEYNCCKEQK